MQTSLENFIQSSKILVKADWFVGKEELVDNFLVIYISS